MEDGRTTAALPRAGRIAMYHSVSPSTEPDPHSIRIHPDLLNRQLAHLRRRGLRGVSMAEWLAAVRRGRAGRLVALTFDDGYLDFVRHAMPILNRHGCTASAYVVAGKLGGTSDWLTAGPRVPLVTADDVRAIAAAGHEVGSHAMSHSRLSELPSAAVDEEVRESRRILEDLLQQPVTGLAYPYGAFDDDTLRSVGDAGYAYACTTDVHTHRSPFAIARFFIGRRDVPLRLEAKFVRHRVRALTGAAHF